MLHYLRDVCFRFHSGWCLWKSTEVHSAEHVPGASYVKVGPLIDILQSWLSNDAMKIDWRLMIKLHYAHESWSSDSLANLRSPFSYACLLLLRKRCTKFFGFGTIFEVLIKWKFSQWHPVGHKILILSLLLRYSVKRLYQNANGWRNHHSSSKLLCCFI